MVYVRLYFDKRRLDKDGNGQVRLVVSKNGTSAMMSLGVGIREDQWKNGRVVNHEHEKMLNNLLSIKKGMVDRTILEQTALGTFVGKTAKDVVEYLKGVLDPDVAKAREDKEKKEELERNSFTLFFSKYIETKEKPGTRKLYTDTLEKIRLFCKSESIDFEYLSFTDITRNWLESFQSFCMKTQKQNTASRHLRDIRAVINAAIDKDLTNVLPFRKFKIKKQVSLDKSFKSKELRILFDYTPYLRGEKEAIDIFKLMFCLIGINCVDLAYANKVIRDRLEYDRAKTGKHYSIRIEPEAMEIIKKYKGTDFMVNLLERVPNYKTYFNRTGKNLKKVWKKRIIDGKKIEGEDLPTDICLGSARTSWATIAQEELDIPREIIQAALGHLTIDVTDTYLRTDWKKKVDDANRKVLDWVLYGKKTP